MSVTDEGGRALVARLGPLPNGPLGVALSGGSDSTALLHLLAEQRPDRRLIAVTVDHGLRPEAADEAQQAGRMAADLGIAHEVLRWDGWDGEGNLQDRARRARYQMMSDWARAKGLAAMTVGHTRDDQAETFLMRLARRAGIDGLAAMAPVRQIAGVEWHRPLLHLGRSELRAYLSARGVGWVDDPSNEDPSFDRVRARQALSALTPVGIDVEGLADVARNLADAQVALAYFAAQFVRDHVEEVAGALKIARGAFLPLPFEMRRRLLAAGISWVSGADYPPRGNAVAAVLDQLTTGHVSTLGGAMMLPKQDVIWLCREPAAVEGLKARPNEAWDQRWQLTGGQSDAETYLSALGEGGLKQVADWRETGLPRPILLASPALWQGDRLISAPVAGWGQGWTLKLATNRRDFESFLLSR